MRPPHSTEPLANRDRASPTIPTEPPILTTGLLHWVQASVTVARLISSGLHRPSSYQLIDSEIKGVIPFHNNNIIHKSNFQELVEQVLDSYDSWATS